MFGATLSQCLNINMTVTFRASCCTHACSSVRDRGKKGRGGEGRGVREDRLHWRVQGRTSSPTGIGSKLEGGLRCYGIWNVPQDQEGKVLFNDALNTFYLQLYVVGHMVNDHSDSERGNPLPPHGLLYPNNSKGSFIYTIAQTGQHIPQPLLHQWLEREIAQWVHPMKDRSDDQSHHERTLLLRSYITFYLQRECFIQRHTRHILFTERECFI